MPSSHSATVLGLTTAAALKDGFGSTTFAISAILSIIVIIDACGVRYETGKQSKMLNKIVQEMFTDTENAETHFKEFIGHTPLQVFVGAVLGIIVGIIMFFVFR
jgi:acid phosphatase family membrane protein YuiD